MTDEPRIAVREQLPVWFALLGGAGAWGAHLGLSYLLVPTACRTGLVVLLHATTVVTVTVAASAAFSAYRVFNDTRRPGEHTSPGMERDRSLAVFGLFLNPLFAGLNLFEGLPVFFIDPCIGVG